MSVSRRKLFALDFGSRSIAGDPWLRVHRNAMACRFEVTLSRDHEAYQAAAGEALNEADRIEAMLSVFHDDTEVSRLNRLAPSSPVAVGPELFALIERCVRLHAVTDGAFDITSTPLSRCWGFLKRDGQVPDEGALIAARQLVGLARVQLNRGRREVRFEREGVELNFGAIGKGYAVDRMAFRLRGAGVREALVSAGDSSVFALGGPNGGWLVDVRSPLMASERIARIALRRGALGTSCAGEQGAVADGTCCGRVIDPRTGYPAAGILSSSVITREAAAADALSTAFLIGGPDLARRYCEAHDNTLALLVLHDDARSRCVFGRYPGARIEA
jgi:thiamine biosynthesis lipoprotein